MGRECNIDLLEFVLSEAIRWTGILDEDWQWSKKKKKNRDWSESSIIKPMGIDMRQRPRLR